MIGKVKPDKASKRRKSFCARSAGQMKKFPKRPKNPNSRLRQARRDGNVNVIRLLQQTICVLLEKTRRTIRKAKACFALIGPVANLASTWFENNQRKLKQMAKPR